MKKYFLLVSLFFSSSFFAIGTLPWNNIIPNQHGTPLERMRYYDNEFGKIANYYNYNTALFGGSWLLFMVINTGFFLGSIHSEYAAMAGLLLNIISLIPAYFLYTCHANSGVFKLRFKNILGEYYRFMQDHIIPALRSAQIRQDTPSQLEQGGFSVKPARRSRRKKTLL